MSLCVCFGDSKKDFLEDGPSPSASSASAHRQETSQRSNGGPGAGGGSWEKVVPEEPPPEKNELYKGLSDGVIWNCPLGKHLQGEFSYAVAQANTKMEDYSSVECTSSGTYVGVFDGHGGDQAASFLSQNLHGIVNGQWLCCGCAEASGGLSEDVFNRAFEEADQQLLQVVREQWKIYPAYATAGSCALVGVVEGGTLYVASLGDSRAVLGSAEGPEEDARLAPITLSVEHNVAREEVRQEVLARVPDDPSILQEKGGLWRVKGIIQVARSIGDFYLKRQEFQCPPLYTKYRLPDELKVPALICTPSIVQRRLSARDRFVIFATDGLWDNVTSQEAVDVVQRYPRMGIARRLAKLSLVRAARRRKLEYQNLTQMRPGRRREIHDDVSVVVLFLDHAITPRRRKLESLSVRSMQELQAPPQDVSITLPHEEDVPDDFDVPCWNATLV